MLYTDWTKAGIRSPQSPPFPGTNLSPFADRHADISAELEAKGRGNTEAKETRPLATPNADHSVLRPHGRLTPSR